MTLRFIAGAVPATALGVMIFAGASSDWLGRAIGAFLLASVPLRRVLTSGRLHVRMAHFPFIGGAIGLLSAIVVTTGPVVTPFFLAYGLRRGAFIATEAVCAGAMHVTRGLVFARYTLLTREIVADRPRARGDDVRRRVDRPAAARPHERPGVPGDHRGRSWSAWACNCCWSRGKNATRCRLRPAPSTSCRASSRLSVTADAMGHRGVKVFATPFLISLLEDAAGRVIEPYLAPAATSVGTMIDIRHLAATPVGMTVRARATLLETDGKRFLFQVEAWDDKDKVAEGRHERSLVPDLAKFLDRVMKKGAA